MVELNSLIFQNLVKGKIKKILKAEGYRFAPALPSVDLLKRYTVFHKKDERLNIRSVPIKISNHALERWNERVGPIIDMETLRLVLNYLFEHAPHRLNKLANRLGCIDDDIVFAYDYDHAGQFCITTFYGRKSLSPSLNHPNYLRYYNLKHKNYVTLSIPSHILQDQHIPPIPQDFVVFQGRRTIYTLEKYLITNKETPCFVSYEEKIGTNIVERKIIHLEASKLPVLSSNILYMIGKFGYYRFVFKYFKSRDPLKLEQARKKAEEMSNAEMDK
jgi:hypothetical protein